MPYVKRETRDRLDPLIRPLQQELEDLLGGNLDPMRCAGALNYIVTRLAMTVVQLPVGDASYGTIALVVGVLRTAADELYRRVAAPYEQRMMRRNGDVPEYFEAEGQEKKKS